MILVTNQQQFEESKVTALKDLSEAVMLVQQNYIRKTFDNAKLDSVAQACIDTAFVLGFTELGAEMEKDLETERIIATIFNDED